MMQRSVPRNVILSVLCLGLPVILGLVLIAASISCSPIDDTRDECREIATDSIAECRKMIDETISDLLEWLGESSDECAAEINTIADDLKAWFRETADDIVAEWLIDFGCIPDELEPSGWDCTGAEICR